MNELIRRRLTKLVAVLAGNNHNEIVGNWFIGESPLLPQQVIGSIAITPLGLEMSIWEGSVEWIIYDSQLSKEQLLDLIKQLEDILRN